MNKRGFTLIELILCLAIAGIVIAAVVVGLGRCTSNNAQAEDAAWEWSNSMGLKVKGVTCVDHADSDRYVSCTVSEETEEGTKMHSIECASSWSWNSGCRVPKLHVRP